MAEQRAAPAAGQGPPAAGAPADPRRWLILAVICVSYVMVTLDVSVMNLALPSAQHALHFTNIDRQWILTAYSLTFGSLLLFCGRLADLVGRKTIFLIALAGFAVASAVGGASVSFTMLVTARACQGVFAAMLAPSGLSVLATTFTDPKERGRAFGAFGAVAAGGAGLGLLLGGILTTYASWRWCLYINLVLASVAFAGGALLLRRQPKTRSARLDVPGVILVSGGMFCLVYGFSNAGMRDWHATSAWGFIAAGVALVAVFAGWQRRAAQPLLPPRVVLDRNRGGAYLAMLINGAGMFGILLFLTYYLQVTRGYSAVTSGVALLPMIAVSAIGANVGNRLLLPRLGPRPVVIAGMLAEAAGMAWLTRIGPESGYAAAVLGPIMVTAVGMGAISAVMANTGTFGVAPRDAGVASACLSTGQQLGGAIGTVVLNTIAAGATSAYLAAHLGGPRLAQLAAVHADSTVFWWCAGLFAAGALVCGALMRSGPLARPRNAASPQAPSPRAAATPS
jgi:EmrB/QacA subfamily drug resistance transporter